jgi:hypothetical protein
MGEEGTTVFPTLRGQWSNPVILSGYDLAVAMACNIQVRVLRGWVADCVSTPFSAFMHLAFSLRASDFPGIAKQAGNTLYGTFGASSNLAMVTFAPGKRGKIRNLPPREALSLPISCSVLSRMRSRLYLEAVGNATIHAHTDGIMVPHANAPYHLLSGEGLGKWRIANRFSKVEILTPSWYRTISDYGESFKMAGHVDIDHERARRLFGHYRERMLENGS